jgi:AraC-like DNA-binding protein
MGLLSAIPNRVTIHSSNPTAYSEEIRKSIDDQWFDVDSIDRPVAVVSIDYPTGWFVEEHLHRKGQLIYCSSGVLTVEAEGGVWIAPPHRAIWVPALMPHKISVNLKAEMRTVFVQSGSWGQMPQKACAVNVSPLLRELILEAVKQPILYELHSPMSRIVDVLLDQIVTLPVNPLYLPYPIDARLTPICSGLTKSPGDRRNLNEWAKTVGASARTVERLFIEETGMTFHRWREQIRILHSLTLLGQRRSVKTTAMQLGFTNPSAFINMFRKVMGVTPGEYYQDT